MSGSPRYWLTRAAEMDLTQIVAYMLETWGEKQLQIYQNQLEQRLQSLVDFPEIGRKHPMLANDTLYICEGRHYIFYRKNGPGIVVLRLLHCRSDLMSRLSAYL
jgi:toxin ParE1/3/4